MNSKQIESKVRKIVAEAKKRDVWGNAHAILTELNTGERVVRHEGYSVITREVRIYTGSDHYVLSLETSSANKWYTKIEIARASGEIVFKAHLESDCTHPAREQEVGRVLDRIRHIRRTGFRCVVIEKYQPGQWERILHFLEAKRLLDEERDARASLILRKGADVYHAEHKLAMDFGLKP